MSLSLPAPEEVGNEEAERIVEQLHHHQQQQKQQLYQNEANPLAATEQPLFSSSSSSPSPPSVATVSCPWQYDDWVTHCASCQAPFTPLNRRHHCRLCGNIFCNPCSRQRALIPPSRIVLVPKGGKKVKPRDYSATSNNSSSNPTASFTPDDDPDRMLTYLASSGGGNGGGTRNNNTDEVLLYGKGLEERFLLARQPLRVCQPCHRSLAPLQDELVSMNSNAMRFNSIDPTDPKRLFNSPLAFTLGHEIRKAAYTLNNLLPLPKRMGRLLTSPGAAAAAALTSSDDYFGSTANNANMQQQECAETCSALTPTLGNLDGVRIPARLLERAKGVAVLTVLKTGLGVAGLEVGTGLVVARVAAAVDPNSDSGGSRPQWSAPSAIGTAGCSWGALVGAQVSDHVFLLMTDEAVELLFTDHASVQLGVDVGMAVGPLGRAAEADWGAAPGKVAPIYTYSLSKGLYAGISVDGKVIVTRRDVNERFYGRTVSAMEILQGAVPTPPAAQPLYEALQRCHVYASSFQAQSSTSKTMKPMLMPPPPPATPRPLVPEFGYDPQQQRLEGEYGEIAGASNDDGGGVQPPALGDAHSYAGFSDITSDPGY